ncbi:MAG: TlpA family protein disulfide reductase [Bacteroidia bacterium]|nr:TlpA family protein disulfide reductase [Bacteroidia bacterium]
MKSKNFLLSVLILAFVLSFFIIRYMKTVNYPELPELVDLNGNVFNKSDLEGKLYIVSYFQTWCSDCVKEKPQLEALQKQFGADKIVVLLVSDEPKDKLLQYAEKFKSSLTIYHSDKSLKKDIGIRAYPTTFLFGKNGQLLRKSVEGMDWDDNKVIQLISNQFK